MRFFRFLFLIPVFLTSPAFADGIAKPWQLGFQAAATPVMERITHMHNALLVIITLISIFVLILLAIVVVRFNHRANPTPSKNAHNTMLEIAWTTIPVLILIGIAIPSLKLTYYMDKTEKADMTLKVVGRQWYWEYEYPDQKIGFESRIIADKDLQPGQPRLLTVDHPLYIPVDTVVRLQTTGGDVIHAWAMPAFGVKIDAVPGRLNETWFEATKTGVYYGQCSELCGVDHGFMPIELHVVSKDEFATWVAAQQKSADAGTAAIALNIKE
jgi:cytochrome c oxidase subunit 2